MINLLISVMIFLSFSFTSIVFILCIQWLVFYISDELKCSKASNMYRYKRTCENLSSTFNNVYDLLNYFNVLVPIKISRVKIGNRYIILRDPILFNHKCELNPQYIEYYYLDIWKCKCRAIVDEHSIIQDGLFSTMYHNNMGYLELLDYNGSDEKIQKFCSELSLWKGRIYRMANFESCEIICKCPLLYTNPIYVKTKKSPKSCCKYSRFSFLRKKDIEK